MDSWFDGLMENSDNAYRSLLSRGLIEDPIPVMVQGIAILVLGLDSCQLYKTNRS
jgi:hypothetical protein